MSECPTRQLGHSENHRKSHCHALGRYQACVSWSHSSELVRERVSLRRGQYSCFDQPISRRQAQQTILDARISHDCSDMVAAVGETSAGPSLKRLRDRMLDSPEGRRILKERPRINTHTVDMQKLASLPVGTFGRWYVEWLDKCQVTPDTREPVQYPFSFTRSLTDCGFARVGALHR